MMFSSLPKDLPDLMQCSWAQLEPYYQDLIDRPLNAANVGGWLTDWTRLGEIVHDLYSRLYVGITIDTADVNAEGRYQNFLDGVFPQAQAADQKLKEKLLASRLELDGFEMPLRNMRAEAAIFQEANLPLLSREMKLGSECDKIAGAQTVTWEGEERTLTQIQKVYLEADRSQRERAWRLAMARQIADRQAINALWVSLMDVRRQLAENAHLPTYRDYRWQQLLRFDYTPQDCFTFHQAIEQVAVPAAQRLYERRRRRLGIDNVRPWDVNVDPYDPTPLHPFAQVEELERKAAAVFSQVNPQLGEYFEIMRREGLLDLENRKCKAPGGYCTEFLITRRPFIFMNAVGVHDDVQTLIHEGGHAFHIFEAAHLPYVQQFQVGIEFCEVASTAMELLGSSYLAAEADGFYSPRDAARARVQLLETSVTFLPYMAVVDAFQHWAYENHAAASDPANCDAKWAELWGRFMQGVDWSGLDKDMVTGWQRKLHIPQSPFYYIEYGLAQVGALQVWRNALREPAGAVAAYRRALSLGGTLPIPQLYAVAGAKFAFDATTLGEVVDLAEQAIAELEAIIDLG